MKRSDNIKEKKRIWELDFVRGVAIIGVIFVHVVYDLTSIYGLDFTLGPVFDAVQKYGSLIFIVLSGICVTLGRHNLKRGVVVMLCGGVISGVTYLMVHLDMLSKYAKIDFGILSCLGLCMILYSLFKDANKWLIFGAGIVFVALGFYVDSIRLEMPYFIFLGLRPASYSAGDYFPMLPNFGYFLVGAFLGKTVYKNKKTLMPRVNDNSIIIRCFSFLGRQSLWIYLAHQPVAYGVLYLIFHIIGQ